MKTERTMTELVAAIRGGDQDAFTELYEQTSQEVYRTARAVLRDEDEALDVQQDTFVFAYQHLDQLSEPEKLRPWLRTIAVNRAKSVLRKNTPVLFTELENDEGEGLPEQADLSLDASPELSLEQKETAELVNEILSGLSDGQRAAVAMYYYEQMSVNEIAASLGVSSSTVKNQLAKGRKKIEEAVRALEKKGVKLYGLSPIGFLVALMKRQAPTAQAGEAVLAKTLAKAGIAAGAKTAAAAATVTAVPVTASTFGHVLAGRLAAGILAVALIGGGIWGGAKLLKSSNTDAPYQPTTSVTDERMAGVETPEELTETVVPETEAVVAPTDATVNSVTDPVATEPKETEPVATEPKETEPEETEAEETSEFVPDPSWPTGSCGDNLTWYFDAESGCLTLVGSGAMHDYDDGHRAPTPWEEYREQITALTLPEGMTYVGTCAFQGCQIKSVRIPSTVTRIGNAAFSGSSLQSVTLPEGLTQLGSGAFSGSRLQSVKLPESLTHLGDGAFDSCPMRSITIPAAVRNLGERSDDVVTPFGEITPFENGESLEEINVDPANATYFSVDGVLFSRDGTLLRYPCAKADASYAVPNGVQKIGYQAFYSCNGLKSLTLPDGLTRIGEYAFAYCENLESLNLPDSVTSIGQDVMLGTRYESVQSNWYMDGLYLDNWLLCVEDGIIQTIEIREGTIGLADGSCTGNMKFTLTSVKLPSGLRYIGYGVFFWDSNLSEVTIPDSVIEIGDSAFEGCAALSELKLGSSLQRIGRNAFDNCDALVNVTIPASVTEIGEEAFGYTYRQQNGLVPGFTIHGRVGTAAQSYADANGFTFVAEAE